MHNSSPPMERTCATQLLVSVKNADEARLARRAGVDWIDLKNPDAGPLGCPELPIAREVAGILRDHSNKSAALGELLAIDLQQVCELARLYPVLKAGLSGCAAAPLTWQDQLRLLAQRAAPLARLVPVIYADYRHCAAPEPNAILDQAVEIGSEWVLIDTFVKNGTSLLDCLSLNQLKKLCVQAKSAKITLVLAGSLTLDCARQLLPLKPAVLGVRGAVCLQGRNGEISAAKIEQWLQLLKPILSPDFDVLAEPFE